MTPTDSIESVVLARRRVSDRVTWEARRSTDRGRLEVVAVVSARGPEQVEVQMLSEAELKALLGETAATDDQQWGRA